MTIVKFIDGDSNETIFYYPEGPGQQQGRRNQPLRIEYPTFERRLQYDRRGRVVAETDRWLENTQWHEQTTRTHYDIRGNHSHTVNTAQHEMLLKYDALARVSSLIDALDQITTYQYDNRNNLIGLTDANGNTHRFSYNRVNRMLIEARPMGEITTFTYDLAGQLTERVDAVGHRAVYEYDLAGRREKIRHYNINEPDTPERSVQFTFDAVGRMTGYNDGQLSATYSYDALGRKISTIDNYPGITKTHQQTWHANGRQASLTAAHGTTYGFSWGDANRLLSVVVPGQGVIAYSEYEWMRPATIEFPGGTTRTNTFDGLQRHKSIAVTNASGQTLMDYDYTWNEAGNITEKTTEHGSYLYAYDEIDRLTEAQYPTFSTEQWTYDPLGNRLTDAQTGDTQWQYNANNELLNSVNLNYEYDANGSLIAQRNPDGSLYRSYEYDAETRLSAVRNGLGELIAEYQYDPFGRRVSKTVYEAAGQTPLTTWYLYSDEGLMAELDEQGSQTEFYLFPPDGLWSTDPILRRSGNNYYYYQTDHLSTPQRLIDGSGEVVHSREMRAFGEIKQAGIEDKWRFPGQLHSSETAVNYNLLRIYDEKTGRYSRVDPIGIVSDINLYRYGRNNPQRYFDPTGLYPIPTELPANCWIHIVDDESIQEYRSFENDPWVVNREIIFAGVSIRTRAGRSVTFGYVARLTWEQITYNFFVDITDIEYLVGCLEYEKCKGFRIEYDSAHHFEDNSRRLEDTVETWREIVFSDFQLPYKPRR